MKKVYLLLIYLLAFTTLNAQYVTLYTPKGSPIQTFINPEGTNEWITTTTNHYIGEYGAENVLAPASRRYNCHSYAWNISEGGTNVVWMNQYDSQSNPNIWKYWTDGSYVETTENDAEKIFYYNGDHSAIKSKNVAGKYESKWGQAPLMRHNPTEGPSIYNMAYRRYYKKAPPSYSISGPSNICGQGTYTYTINLPNNIPVSWNVSSDIRIVSEQNNSVTVERNPNTYYMYTDSYIVADVGEPYYSSYERKDIITWKQGSIRTTDLIDISSSPNDYGQPYRYTAQLKGDLLYRLPRAPEWSVSAGLNLEFNDGTMIRFTSNSLEGEYIMVRLTNPCGENLFIHHVLGDQSGYYSSFSLSPNPATDVVTVRLEEESSRNSATLLSAPYEIQLWSAAALIRTYKTDQSAYQISVSDLTKGMYFVRVIKDGKTQTKKLLKN